MKFKVVEPLSIDESAEGGGALLTVNGRVTIDSSPVLRDHVHAILQRKSLPVLTIDLSAVPYVDASGLATLVEALKIARSNKTTLRLRLHERPRYLLEVTGLLSFFESPRDVSANTVSKDT